MMTPPGTLPAPAAAPARAGLALLVIAAAQLVLVLDGTIINVALPAIRSALAIPPADLNWVLTAYALTFGGLLLAGGRAGDLYGRRRMFRAGLVLFTAASLLGGLATTGPVLVAARALQGAGAAVAAPTALSLLAAAFPAGPARTRALGVYGAMGGLGSVAGLLLGGTLTQYLDWRWVFFVNIPLAALVLAGTAVLPEGGRDGGGADLPGALTATLGLGSLVFGINRATVAGWTAPIAIGSLATAVALLAAFLLLQRHARAPMLPRGVLRDRGRAGANLIMFLTGAGMFATFYFLTLYMQGVRGYGPLVTGVAYLPFALGIGLGSGAAGPRLLARLSERAVTLTGLVLAVAGMLWLAMLTPATPYAVVLLPGQLTAGIGLGLTFVTTVTAGVRGVAPGDTGAASGLVNTSQQIGGALGLAVLTAVAAAATADMGAPASVTTGYTTALLAGAALYAAALPVTAVTLRHHRAAPRPADGDGGPAPAPRRDRR
ncbi:MFS transporter [Sphaerisporangium rufum]|uniref:MFS transporter n=1 Tax=Sphaerisporangium rufum TaxID=1381558 RepID=A0A919R1M1_9ACTN|nr:MFS transporter [Sphaerisporangium rufum]GII77959.1 MFS transporter [Sphaerisporangium rufum]